MRYFATRNFHFSFFSVVNPLIVANMLSKYDYRVKHREHLRAALKPKPNQGVAALKQEIGTALKPIRDSFQAKESGSSSSVLYSEERFTEYRALLATVFQALKQLDIDAEER